MSFSDTLRTVTVFLVATHEQAFWTQSYPHFLRSLWYRLRQMVSIRLTGTPLNIDLRTPIRTTSPCDHASGLELALVQRRVCGGTSLALGDGHLHNRLADDDVLHSWVESGDVPHSSVVDDDGGRRSGLGS